MKAEPYRTILQIRLEFLLKMIFNYFLTNPLDFGKADEFLFAETDRTGSTDLAVRTLK